MAANGKKRYTFISRSAPYGRSRAHQCLEMALATAVFEQEINYLFLGEGVLQLAATRDAGPIGNKALGNALKALDLYGVEKRYVEQAALESWDLDSAALAVVAAPLDDEGIRQLLEGSDVVINL